MAELSCPCWRSAFTRRGFASPKPVRLALFLLKRGQLSGAVLEGKVLDQQQAQQLWNAWCWQPASEGQPWPAMDPGGQALQQGPMPLW